MTETYDLANLRDILLPQPPPLWPPAPGLWLLLAVVAATVLIVVFQWRRARAHSAYRRAGLARLEGARTVRDVSVILKRVALAAFPREQVASLYGEDWAAFLQRTDSGGDFPMIAQAEPSVLPDDRLKKRAAFWIRAHRAGSGRLRAGP